MRLRADARGLANAAGPHECAVVESHGHGIYGATGDDIERKIGADGAVEFAIDRNRRCGCADAYRDEIGACSASTTRTALRPSCLTR